MTRLASLIAAITLSSTSAYGATTTPFTDIILFGDSTSDGGNVFLTTSADPITFPTPIPDPAIYPERQFTNGDTWATQLGIGPSLAGGTNFAFGDAEAVAEPDDLVPDLDAQIDLFLPFASLLGPNPLGVMFIGGNDLREITDPTDPIEVQSVFTQTIEAITDGITKLRENSGIKHVAVFNMPNLGLLPGTDPIVAPVLKDASERYNEQLSDALDDIPNTITIDIFTLLNDVAADPGAFGFSNVDEACILSIDCSDPNTFLFYDPVHVSARAHGIIAEEFATAIAPIPSPAAGMLLLTGMVAFAAVRRRRT